MRSKKTVINTLANLLEEIVAICCGFVLPRLILSTFGSEYNGLVTSINQFLSCSVLLRAGIGGVTRAALYKPLANNDKNAINRIMKATDIFMKKIGLILLIGISFLSVTYPFFVIDQFEWITSFSLFLIIGLSTLAESFFGITYLILLQADQKVWVFSLFKAGSYTLNLLLVVVLIRSGLSIHIVKFGSTIIFSMTSILLKNFVKNKYSLDLQVKPDEKAISQRWSAFWHQTASFVMNNTDIMVLTIFTDVLEVSVYSIYNLIANALKTLVYSFSSGLEAAFGNMIAKKEDNALKENLSLIEWVIYSISTIAYTCASILIISFVELYTEGICDVDYIRPIFAFILLTAHFLSCIRIPYQMVVQAAGHYKQTKNGAIVESVINLMLSIALVTKFGLVGVGVGTFVATLFRTIQYSKYMCDNIIKRKYNTFLFRILVSLLEGWSIVIIAQYLNCFVADSYIMWLKNAVIVGGVSCFVVGIGSVVFYKKDIMNVMKKMKKCINVQKIRKEI